MCVFVSGSVTESDPRGTFFYTGSEVRKPRIYVRPHDRHTRRNRDETRLRRGRSGDGPSIFACQPAPWHCGGPSLGDPSTNRHCNLGCGAQRVAVRAHDMGLGGQFLGHVTRHTRQVDKDARLDMEARSVCTRTKPHFRDH